MSTRGNNGRRERDLSDEVLHPDVHRKYSCWRKSTKHGLDSTGTQSAASVSINHRAEGKQLTHSNRTRKQLMANALGLVSVIEFSWTLMSNCVILRPRPWSSLLAVATTGRHTLHPLQRGFRHYSRSHSASSDQCRVHNGIPRLGLPGCRRILHVIPSRDRSSSTQKDFGRHARVQR